VGRERERRLDPARYRREYLKLRSALFDRTTGMPAFPVLFSELRSMLEHRRRIGVLHLEIVNLHLVESLYGWQVFDRILLRAAAVLSDAVGVDLPAESRLALSGVAGDRFAIFVPSGADGEEVDSATLARMGERLRGRLEEAFADESLAGLSPRPGFCIGHAQLSHNPFYRFERRVYAALDEARAYDEKRRRRRELFWNDELREIIREAAVETVFQPVIDLRSHDVLGYEALTRGPKDSPLEMPQEMFAASDRHGVAADLDRICSEAALKAAAAVADMGKLFLNVLPFEPDELREAEERLAELIESSGLVPGDLVLEFSERRANGDSEAFLIGLEGLKARGFGIALDDVGTGYGSQAIFERARPDYLKLDVSLVHEIDRHLIKRELLQGLIRVAERIDAAVIAEGVETENEAAALLEAGTRYGQGYYFAQPAPAGSVLRPIRRPTGH
jgi:EAL domain-containing protein (putative c-di-GMP-specific phosphodiesterase class I)/GGDEF domain-containing protein